MSDTGEETALFRKGATVAHHCEGIHLETVVIMESERLMLYDTQVELESACCEPIAAARVAGIQNRHVVFLCHCIDGVEQAQEVLFCVDILLSVGAQQDVFPFFEAETFMYI